MSVGRTRVLVVSDRRPVDLAHGRDLRILHLVGELAGEFEVRAVDLSAENTGGADVPGNAAVEHFSLPCRPNARANAFRHLRLSDAGFPRRAYPDYYEGTAAALAGIVRKIQPSVIINFSRFAAELVADLGPPAVLDWSDSASLALHREMAVRSVWGRASGGPGAWMRRVRAVGRERYLVNRYPAITTISPQERDQLLKVSAAPKQRVTVIPNGVGQAALDAYSEAPRERSVVFWGNLDFPPNWTAIRFFYERIFREKLAPAGIGFHVIGRGGDGPLAAVFRDSLVTRHGFVDDIYGLLGGPAVMVNPMIQGGGMKNKVLEAFACGIPVVSTALGLDGINAQAGIHCLVAEDAPEFADAVRKLLDDEQYSLEQARSARRLVEDHYTWAQSAGGLKALITDLVQSHSVGDGKFSSNLRETKIDKVTREVSG